MIKLKPKKEEYDLFDNLSQEWWDENGKFKVLHKITPIRMEYILSQINNKKLSQFDILDIGCGGGLISEPLARLGAKVTGIDFVEKNIKIAKSHAKSKNLKINYMCQDIELLNLNKKFDVIIMFEILEHLEDWKKFLINIKRSLKPNGIIILSTINKNIISKYSAIYFAENILNWIPKGTHDFNKFIKPEEIINGLKKEKIKVIDLKGLIFNPLISNWHLSNNKLINYFCTLKIIN